MIESMLGGDQMVNAESRSILYQALSLGWRHPSREALSVYRSGRYWGELLELAAKLPHLSDLVERETATAEMVRHELAEVPFEVFEARYVAAFEVGLAQPTCPPYEGLYNRRICRASVMAEVSRFYRRLGPRMNRDGRRREPPDHLCDELEFLAFLTFREALAAEDGPDELQNGYRWAQKDFLERHMVGWLPALAARLAEEVALPFYPHLARFTNGFTSGDFHDLIERLTPRDFRPAQPLLSAPGAWRPYGPLRRDSPWSVTAAGR